MRTVWHGVPIGVYRLATKKGNLERRREKPISTEEFFTGWLNGRRAALTIERLALQKYLQHKVEVEDFHGVADAAMDLRDCDAALLEISRIEKEINSVYPNDGAAGERRGLET